MKKRLDVLLVERGLAESRSQAQALVIAGLVPGYDKPGTQLDESIDLEIESPPPYVSRGGEKLAHALEVLESIPPVGTVSTSAPRQEASRTASSRTAPHE